MTITRTARIRSVLALAAGAALLGITACGTDGDPAGEPITDAAAGASDDGGEAAGSGAGAGAGADDDSVTGDDDGDQDQEDTSDGEADEEQDGAGADEGAEEEDGQAGASGERTRLLLVTDVGEESTSGDGAPVLPAEDLATLLAEPFEVAAECEGEFTLEPGGESVVCLGPESWDSTDPTQEWVANTVSVPGEAGLEEGARVAVLFSTGDALPEAAESLLDEDVTLTGVGMGTMFGSEPLSAAELEEATLQTLTSENAYVPVDTKADWSEVTCEDGLDFAEFGTVDCTAGTADGDTWPLHVAPGSFADNDPGLLVGIRTR